VSRLIGCPLAAMVLVLVIGVSADAQILTGPKLTNYIERAEKLRADFAKLDASGASTAEKAKVRREAMEELGELREALVKEYAASVERAKRQELIGLLERLPAQHKQLARVRRVSPDGSLAPALMPIRDVRIGYDRIGGPTTLTYQVHQYESEKVEGGKTYWKAEPKRDCGTWSISVRPEGDDGITITETRRSVLADSAPWREMTATFECDAGSLLYPRRIEYNRPKLRRPKVVEFNGDKAGEKGRFRKNAPAGSTVSLPTVFLLLPHLPRTEGCQYWFTTWVSTQDVDIDNMGFSRPFLVACERRETITVGRRRVPCTLYRVRHYQTPILFWVDARGGIPRFDIGGLRFSLAKPGNG